MRSATLAALLVCACASDKQTDGPSKRPRGPGHSIPVEEVAAQPSAAAPQPWDPFGASQAAKPAEEATKKAPDERDYGAELLAAMGSPAQCLKTRAGPDAPSAIAISLEATVVETGIVTRNLATSAQLDEGEIKCVQARLAGLRLRAPIPDAPRTVRATLELNQQAPAAKPAPTDDEGSKEEKEADAPDQEPAAPLEGAGEEEPREEEPRAEEPRDEEPRDQEPRDEEPRDQEPRDEEPRDQEPGPSEDQGSEDTAQPPE